MPSWAEDKARELAESDDGCGGFNSGCRNCRILERAIRETIEKCAEAAKASSSDAANFMPTRDANIAASVAAEAIRKLGKP